VFFETVVRVHRAGEVPHTPASTRWAVFRRVIPLAKTAVETGSAEPVMDFLSDEPKGQLRRRLDEVTRLAAGKGRSVQDARRWVEAMLGFEVYCHRLSGAAVAGTPRARRRSRGLCRVGRRSVSIAAACG
jgi:Family of unknown function (DUF6448)